MLIELAILILIIAFIKAVHNALSLRQCKKFENLYKDYIDEKINWPELISCQHKIIRSFEQAGLKDRLVPVVEPVGHTHVRTLNASVFANLIDERDDFKREILFMFKQAQGVYKSRLIETFNPLYWVFIIVYAPSHIITYLGLPTDNVFTKFSQLIFWLLGILLSLWLLAYRADIREYIRTLGKEISSTFHNEEE